MKGSGATPHAPSYPQDHASGRWVGLRCCGKSYASATLNLCVMGQVVLWGAAVGDLYARRLAIPWGACRGALQAVERRPSDGQAQQLHQRIVSTVFGQGKGEWTNIYLPLSSACTRAIVLAYSQAGALTLSSGFWVSVPLGSDREELWAAAWRCALIYIPFCLPEFPSCQPCSLVSNSISWQLVSWACF